MTESITFPLVEDKSYKLVYCDNEDDAFVLVGNIQTLDPDARVLQDYNTGQFFVVYEHDFITVDIGVVQKLDG